MNIFILDEQREYREGMKRILSLHLTDLDITICDESWIEEQPSKFDESIVIIDVFSYPDNKGLKLLEKVISLGAKVIVLSMVKDNEQTLDILSRKVKGFVLKSSSGQILVNAVLNVIENRIYLDNKLSCTVLEGYQKMLQMVKSLVFTSELVIPTRPKGLLTKREWEVLELSARGLSNSEIAQTLYITDATASTHIKNVVKKLEVNTTIAAVLLALKNNWIVFEKTEKVSQIS
ncbi:DNA-binding response regulator [Bacillus salitolerans]|uniref:DNA-binding response regulator n=1 Tax=Bacillus salitolerans TaxID=1437434 RepID=A0ABW4LQ46_9BACI